MRPRDSAPRHHPDYPAGWDSSDVLLAWQFLYEIRRRYNDEPMTLGSLHQQYCKDVSDLVDKGRPPLEDYLDV